MGTRWHRAVTERRGSHQSSLTPAIRSSDAWSEDRRGGVRVPRILSGDHSNLDGCRQTRASQASSCVQAQQPRGPGWRGLAGAHTTRQAGKQYRQGRRIAVERNELQFRATPSLASEFSFLRCVDMGRYGRHGRGMLCMQWPNFTHRAHVLRDFAVDHQPQGPGPSAETAFRLQRAGAGYATTASPPSTVDRTLTMKASLIINPSLRSHRMKGARTRPVPP